MKKYLTIYHDLLSDIQTKKYQSGEILPSNQQLVMRYHVSRETVRKAIQLLADEGYIQTIRGKGSLVLVKKRYLFPVSSIKSYKEIVDESGLDSVNRVLKIQDHVLVPERLRFGSPEMYSQLIVRERIVNGIPTILDYDYINEDVSKDVPEASAKESLFGYFENELGLTVDYAVKHLTVENAEYDDCDLLKIDQAMPMVVVRSETHLTDSRILSYTESRHRADKFSSVEFARRHH
ncbi:trehalose operon repressor [Companilactobacillus huachuanensis]|uniref:Trehalose operon repressor n=1 Tax=Companilactobacillus huachuanensis TaxID=2559914 RepID=A0ABW1RQ91_9LACO|nr:trehalose operon repressor [Companilactobacillus huachuanensis]